jgi:CRISPR system Cascade subunit CasC
VLAAIFGKLDTVEGKELFIKQLAFISTGEKKKLQAILSRLKSDDAFRAQLLRAADDIGADPEDEDGAEDDESSEKRKKKKQSKETTKLIKSLREECMLVTDSAVDIAMFGRMLADSPTFNREASVQVAHAITTHRAPVEDDYYTAVDDLKKPDEDMGAGFVGEQEFGSGVFYVYLCADRALLKRNLGDDATADSLARTGLAALIEAACTAFPKGKQASFASRPITAYALAEKGDRQPRTLASAFLEPINGGNLLDRSIAALETVCKELDQAYGSLADERATMRVHANGSHKAEGTLADLKTFASTD